MKGVMSDWVEFRAKLCNLIVKKLEKAVASVCGTMELGKTGDVFRERRLSKADQSLRGCLLQMLIRLRK